MVQIIRNPSGFAGYSVNPNTGTFTAPFMGYTNQRIPLPNNAVVQNRGRSALDNIYGMSTDPRIAANPPSVVAMNNANQMGLLNKRNVTPSSYASRMMSENQPSSTKTNTGGFSSQGQELASQGLINQQGAKPSPTEPKKKNQIGKGLLDFVNSPFGTGFAQGLLQASGYSPMPVSFGQALGQALQTAEQSVDRDFDKQQTEFMNQLRQSAEDREQRKFDAEISLIDQQVLDNEEVKGILKNTKLSDFDSDSDYYRSVANQLIQMGKTSEAAEFLKLATPTSVKEMRQDTLSANKDEGKTFKEIQKGITTYKQLQDALQQNDGAAAYAVMIKFIKQLDDSVVREGEVRNFTQFQGLFNQLKIEVDKAQGKGFPPETKAAIGNLANKTFTSLIEDYAQYQNQKATGLYTELGMNPELVFSGYDVSQYENDINQSFTADDFSTDQMYDDYGSLAEIKRKFKDTSDEELKEYLKNAPDLEVQHYINLGFIDR